MREDERRLVLAVEIASELKSRNAFRAVDDDDDCRQQIGESHLAASQDRPGRHAELVMASLVALVAAARFDVIGFDTAATRAAQARRSFPANASA